MSNWFPYNTQCSSQQMPSSMPITHFPLSPNPHQPSVFSQYLRVFYGLPPSLSVTFFPPSPPHWSSVKFLRISVDNLYPNFLVYFFLFVFLFVGFYIIFRQIGFHTTPSAHPNRCPLQCPSPTFPSPPTPIYP